MKRSDMQEKLAKHLVRRDQYLGLNLIQAMELARLFLHFSKREGMLPPCDNRGLRINKEAINYCKWEAE